jgi:di/tricarboxylate transporter
MSISWEAWLTIGVIVLILIALARNWAGPDIILLGGLTLLLTAGLFSTDHKLPNTTQAIVGFGNKGPITVGVLYVVVAGLMRTGAMTLVTAPLLGMPRSVAGAQARLLFPVGTMSAFLNNTPIVAMFMPVVGDWAKKIGISPSKLFLPLSYIAICGGVCTLIGTSTNLVVNGLVQADPDLNMPEGISMFAITWIGLPVFLLCIIYILLASRWLLPDRQPAISRRDDPRQYTVEMTVAPDGPLVAKTIGEAGLRHLPGLYLVEIDRGDQVIAAVSPNERLHANDRLVFAGVLESVVDLRKMRGLNPATDQVFKLDSPQTQRCMIEAVVSDSCPLRNKSIREGRFRTNYNAVVLAVARNGERIRNEKIGDIILHPGDTLLLEAHPSFVAQQRDSRDFYLVSQVEDSAPIRHHLAWVALATLGLMVLAVTLGWLSMLHAAMLAAGAMVLTRCCSGTEARRSVDWQVLLVIGAALGIGQAVEMSGAADAIASKLVGFAAGNPWLVLLMIYFVTVLFTELITNNAAAVLVYPIAKISALTLGVSFTPFIFAIMVAASASFATPIGYQTNLMVYGPGGYRFTDYLRFGLPLSLLVLLLTVGLVPLIWPF